MLLPRDRERLVGVQPDLVRVVERARQAVPFIVTEGVRSRERQARLVAIGASRTMHSRHLTGHAVDLAYWLDDGDGTVEQGEIRWDSALYEQIGAAMKAAAKALGVPIVWGGDWVAFRDGPHFELDRKTYPVTAFAAAMDVLAADPNLGTDAIWQRGGGPIVALRVLRSSPDQLRDAFGTGLIQATDVLTVPSAVLPEILAGDVFTLGTEILTVQHAERDAAGVAWRVLCQR